MEQIGIVRRISENNAEVEVRRISGCGGSCGSCGGCEVKSVTVLLKNNIGAREGDVVEIKAAPKKLLKYTLIAYIVPLMMLILGIALGVNYFRSRGLHNYEMYGLGVGMVFLAVSYLIIKAFDKSIGKKDEVAMEMIKVLSNQRKE